MYVDHIAVVLPIHCASGRGIHIPRITNAGAQSAPMRRRPEAMLRPRTTAWPAFADRKAVDATVDATPVCTELRGQVRWSFRDLNLLPIFTAADNFQGSFL